MMSVKIPRLGIINREAQVDDFFQRFPVARGLPRDHEVGRKRDHRFQINLRVAAADGLDAPRLRRIIAVLHHPDHLVAGARREQVFGDVRAQAEDAVGRRRQGDDSVKVIGH